jgi:hypothetical protein
MRSAGAQVQGFEVREGIIVDQQQIKLDNLRPGLAFACIAPLRGNPRDPGVIAEVVQNGTDFPVYCKRLQLPAAPALQHLTIEVQPLPPP